MGRWHDYAWCWADPHHLLLILQEWIQKLPPFFLWLLQIFGEQRRGVFMLYNFSYLHLGPISFGCVTVCSSYN
jgi:hypothetical protein